MTTGSVTVARPKELVPHALVVQLGERLAPAVVDLEPFVRRLAHGRLPADDMHRRPNRPVPVPASPHVVGEIEHGADDVRVVALPFIEAGQHTNLHSVYRLIIKTNPAYMFVVGHGRYLLR